MTKFTKDIRQYDKIWDNMTRDEIRWNCFTDEIKLKLNDTKMTFTKETT